MTKRLLDYDPLTGIRTSFEYTADDQMVITEEQDVTHIMEQNKSMRADTDRSKQGIKNDMWHYARIPLGHLLEMRQKYGVKFEDKNDLPKIIKLINTEYQQDKVTDLQHTIKHA